MSEQKLILEHLRETARRAHTGISFDPEKRAEAIVSEFSAELQEDLQKIPEIEQKRYIENYTSYLTNWLHSLSRTFSTMIAGPSNFPVRRMEKLNRAVDNKQKAFRDWRGRALKAISRKVEQSKTPDQKNDEQWIPLCKKITSSAETIIRIDQGLERGYSRQLFVNTITGRIKRLAQEGNVYLVAKSLELIRELNAKGPKPVIAAHNSIWALADAAEATQAEKKKDAERENEEKEINGIRIVYNHQADRVQVFFRDKSHAMPYRKALGDNAWRWSPSNNAWQRKLTNNAKFDAERIAALTF